MPFQVALAQLRREVTDDLITYLAPATIKIIIRMSIFDMRSVIYDLKRALDQLKRVHLPQLSNVGHFGITNGTVFRNFTRTIIVEVTLLSQNGKRLEALMAVFLLSPMKVGEMLAKQSWM